MIEQFKKDLLAHVEQIQTSIRKDIKVNSNFNKQFQSIIKESSVPIEKADDVNKAFTAGAELNRQLIILINKTLSKIDKQVSLQTNTELLDTLGILIKAMNGLDLCLAQYVEQVIDESVTAGAPEAYWQELKELAKDFVIDFVFPSEFNTAPVAMQHVKEITHQGRLLILSTLLKEAKTEIGVAFIHDYSNAITAKKPLALIPSFTFNPIQTSMGVTPRDNACMANTDQSFDTHTSIETRSAKGVIMGQGGESVFEIPIFIPMEFEDDIPAYFANANIVEKTLEVLMSGRLFPSAQELLYAPLQLILLHELIHVLHNAEGENLRYIPLTETEEKQWTTYEEYHTVRKGKYNEATFARNYDIIQARNAHGVIHTNMLFEPGERIPTQTISIMIKEYEKMHALLNKANYWDKAITFFKSWLPEPPETSNKEIDKKNTGNC